VRAVYVALFVTEAVVAVAALWPYARGLRLWGINHLAFYPLPVKLAAIALIGVSLIPPVARALYAAVLSLCAALAGGGSRSTLLIAAISMASVVTFYHFHAATHLLGDSQLIVQSFEAAEKGHKQVMMRSAQSIMERDHISRGMTLLYYGSVKVAGTVFKRPLIDGLRVLPCLLGGVFVFLVLKMACSPVLSPALRAWLLVLGICTTSLQVFFGYVENYSAILVLLTVYACAGFMLMHRRAPLWVPAALLVVAVFVHIQSILFLPSLVFLVAWRLALVLRYAVPTLVGLTLAGTLAARSLNIPGDFYLPLVADESSYGIVTPGHLLDIANELLMLLPIAGVIAAMGWAARRGRAGGGDDEWFAQPVEWQFVALMVIPCVVYMVFFKSEIGMARDWDLFTTTSIGLVPLALLAIARYVAAGGPDRRRLSAVFAPAMVTTVVLTVSWIGVNASADRTSERFESILAYDQTHAGYAYENLAIYYHSAGHLSKAIHAMEIGARVSSNPRLYARLAVYYEENGDIDGAVVMLRDVLGKHPTHDKVRSKLLDLLEKSRRWPDLVEVARGGVEHHPQMPIYYFALGEGLIRTGSVEEGLDVFRTCLTLDPPEGARQHIERRLKEHGQSP
jgi:hypothetical protein